MLDPWRPADVTEEAWWAAQGVYFLACEVDGQRYMAPLGTPAPPGVTTEVVPPRDASFTDSPEQWREHFDTHTLPEG